MKRNDTPIDNGTNSTGGSGSSDVNSGAIAAGILVPLFIIALGIGAYFGYKKWKQRKEEDRVKEEREKKQGKDDNSRRKKATEM